MENIFLKQIIFHKPNKPKLSFMKRLYVLLNLAYEKQKNDGYPSCPLPLIPLQHRVAKEKKKGSMHERQILSVGFSHRKLFSIQGKGASIILSFCSNTEWFLETIFFFISPLHVFLKTLNALPCRRYSRLYIYIYIYIIRMYVFAHFPNGFVCNDRTN